MSAPRKFDEETRARAVRLYQDRLRDHGESKLAARRHVGQLLDINPATLRNWIEADERAPRLAGRDATNTATASGSGWWCFSSSAVVAASGLVLTAAPPA